jgi:osmotically-inducible protein OsmY
VKLSYREGFTLYSKDAVIQMHKDVRGAAFSLSRFLLEVVRRFSDRNHCRNGNAKDDLMRMLQNREDDVMKMKHVYRRFSLSGRWLAIALLTTGILLNGCAQDIDEATSRAGESVQDVQKSLGEQTQKAGEVITDAAISASVKTDLLNDLLLALSNINVTANAGVVTLSGIVDSQQAMD